MITAYVALGSNLDDPLAQVRRALRRLDTIPKTRVIAISPFYRSEAVGPGEQPHYINAVTALETLLSPPLLLRYLQVIEAEQGRERLERWGPRTLDLDLLLAGDQQWDDDELTLPHPRLAERPFVLYPLYDISPQLHLPNGPPLASLLETVPPTGLERIEIDHDRRGLTDLPSDPGST